MAWSGGVVSLVAAFLLTGGLSSLLQLTSGAEPVPVDQEPRHRIVFANADLRVLEVNVPAGDTTLEHRHDRDLVTVNIENGPTRTREPGGEWGGTRTRDVGAVNITEYTGMSQAHAVQNVGARAYRLTGIENLRQGGWTMYPGTVDPEARVVAEGRAFRAYEVRLGAGRRAVHTHPVPVVVVLVEGGPVYVPPDLGLRNPGEWVLVPAGSSHVFAAGSMAARIAEVEVR
jgi:hypothetical protein